MQFLGQKLETLKLLLQNDLFCVKWDIILYSVSQSVEVNQKCLLCSNAGLWLFHICYIISLWQTEVGRSEVIFKFMKNHKGLMQSKL